MLSRLDAITDSKQRRKLQSAAAVLVVAVVLVLGGAIFLIAAHGTGLFKMTGGYSTTRLVAGSYSNTVECEGVVAPIRVTDVTTKAKGGVTAVYVEDGDYVRQDTVLFEVQDGQGSPQTITASVAGTVTNLNVRVGMTGDELVAANPAMQIADMNVLVGMVGVPEYLSVLLKDGQYANISSVMTPDIQYQGMVTGVSKEKSSALSSSGQALYDATILFDDSGKLHVGEPIVARLRIEDYGQVYYVPPTAVKEVDGVAYVDIVRANETIEQHQVELLGTSDSGQKIIRGGALTSETVILADLDE